MVVSAILLLVSFSSLKAIVKLGKMFFISL